MCISVKAWVFVACCTFPVDCATSKTSVRHAWPGNKNESTAELPPPPTFPPRARERIVPYRLAPMALFSWDKKTPIPFDRL